ncbi:unnamed protein product [Jaminaea pallidilutea]
MSSSTTSPHRTPTARDRELKAGELISDSETESNLSSRPPTPERHQYPRHRLSGLQSKDGKALKHEPSSDGGFLAMTREPTPFDNSQANHDMNGVTANPAEVAKATEAVARATDSKETATVTRPAGMNSIPSSQSVNGARTSAAPSSPPPRAMSPPPKVAATTKVSNNTQKGPGGFVPPPIATNPSSSSLATIKAPAERSAHEKDSSGGSRSGGEGGRGILKRMLSGGHDKDRSGGNQANSNVSPSRSPHLRTTSAYGPGGGSRVPSASTSSPPGTPKHEHFGGSDSASLMHAVQSMNIGANERKDGPSPGSSQPPSRQQSLKRTGRDANEAAAGGEGTSGGRLTAAALRDMESKQPSSSKANQPRDKDARSTASSTLRDMIAGLGSSGPGKLARRGSNVSHGNRSDKSGSEKGDGKSQAGGKSVAGSENTTSLLKKYGVCEKAAIGKGATAVVRLAHKWDRSTEKLYAVKEFRKRRKNETEKEYVKKLTSEFCISSTLHHINIVETVDLVQDENRHWCEVMEYCPGGDLYAAIKRGGMSQGEVECCFKQVLNGIAYLHSMGVAHRDIKPENLLLDASGHVKITDFGVSDVFRMCWEKSTHYSKGLCGSEPYIAPEQFEAKEYDARLVDVWAAAIVFYCMQFQELPWRVAKMSDPTFKEFVHSYHGSPAPSPLSNLSPRDCRPLLKKMLCPDPKGRWGLDEILKDPWLQKVQLCDNGVSPDHKHNIVTATLTSTS